MLFLKRLLAVTFGSVFLGCIACSLIFGGPQDSRTSTLEVQVISRDGAILPYELVSLKDAEGREAKDKCKGSICRSLTWGKYSVVMRNSFGRVVSGQTLLFYPSALLSLAANFEESEGRSVVGRVVGLKAGLNAWVRFQNLFVEYVRDARVGVDGTFTVHGIVGGKYAVIVVQDGVALNNQSFDCCLYGHQITIDLTKGRAGQAAPHLR
jgi:hypothetical protein